MAGNRSGKHDIAPAVRGAFLAALEQIKLEDGKTFSQIIADWFRADPGAVLNAVAKFTVKEAVVAGKLEHEHTHEHTVIGLSETAGFLAEVAGLEEARPPKEPVSH